MPGAAALKAEPAQQVIHLTIEIKAPPKTLLQSVLDGAGVIIGKLAPFL